jgi:hypothetical protein
MELASVRRSVPYTRLPAQLVSFWVAAHAERGAITGLAMAQEKKRCKVRLLTVANGSYQIAPRSVGARCVAHHRYGGPCGT